MSAQDDRLGFTVTHANGRSGARVGCLVTAHGRSETPCFLPIATHGTLRAISFDEAAECGTRIVMANAWHIYREAGPERLQSLGGVHHLMNWSGTVFTDSGGYQIFSLRDTTAITDESVSFGTGEESITPEDVVGMQKRVGSDIMLPLDDCAPYPCSKDRARAAVRRTTLWAGRSAEFDGQMPACYGYPQVLWGIIQGGVHPDLRKRSVEEVARFGFGGYGIGGLSIGMPESAIREMTHLVCERLPHDKPRHLLGVGLPADILEGVERGVDTFDCVLPIRKGQRGVAYTRFGAVRYKDAPGEKLASQPLDVTCRCSTCKTYSREQLRQLYYATKADAGRLAAIHNITFYHQVMKEVREAIRANKFSEYKKNFLSDWSAGES